MLDKRDVILASVLTIIFYLKVSWSVVSSSSSSSNVSASSFPSCHNGACICLSRNLDCSGLNLTSVTGIEWETLDPETHFVFSRNRLRSLPSDFALPEESQSNVVSLDLSQNVLENIEDSAFSPLVALRHLQLQHNHLRSISPRAFEGLARLERLDLSYNRLRNVSDSALTPCVALTELILRYNSLLRIDAALLAPLTKLETLDLNNVALSSLDDDVFANNTMLLSLDLSSNALTRVPTDAFLPLLNLVHLDVSDNDFVEIPPRAFYSLPSLEDLVLNTMDHLQRIDAHAFDGLDSLMTFSCSFNRHLKFIDGAAFRPSDGEIGNYVGRVEQIRLRQNDLSTLSQMLLPWMRVEVVDVQENPWRCDCHLQWMKKIIAEKDPSSHMSKCSSPPSLRNRRVVEVPVHDFVCPANEEEAMLSVVLFLVAFFIVLSVVAFLSCWKIRTCAKCREAYQQRYKKLSTSGREAERVEMECPRPGLMIRTVDAMVES